MPDELKSGEKGVAPSTKGTSEGKTEEVSENKVEVEGLLKEIQELRERQRIAEERAEMLQEKLDALEAIKTEKTDESELDEDEILTLKQAKELTKKAVREALFEKAVLDVAKRLNRSEYKEDFERYLVPLINERPRLVADLVEADDPVAEALSIMERNPKYRKEKEKMTNLKNAEKIKENLNKPKNLSEGSGVSISKKSPKKMTPEEVLEEQEKILSEY